MKAYINDLGIEGFDEKTNYVTGWGTGRLEAEDENIPGYTEVEIIGHTMMLSPKNKWHDDRYEPVVVVAYNNPWTWNNGDKYRRIAYLPAACLLLENDIKSIKANDRPITEEWLKEHGWEYNYSDKERMFIYIDNDRIEWVIPTHYLYIYRNEKIKWIHPGAANVIIDGIVTLSNLYDALELCNIENSEKWRLM